MPDSNFFRIATIINIATILFIYIIFSENFNDATSLTVIYYLLDSGVNNISWDRIYIYLVGSIFGAENIQFGFVIVNMVLVFLLSFLKEGAKLAFFISSALLINPLLHPLIGTVTRSFTAILIIIVIFIYWFSGEYSKEKNKLKLVFIMTIGSIVHPLEFVLNITRLLIFYLMTQLKNLKGYFYAFLLIVGSFIFYSYFGNYFLNNWNDYSTAERSEFNNKKLAVLVFGMLLSIVLYIKSKSPLSFLNLTSWLGLIVFIGFSYFERFWMFPILLTTIIMLNFMRPIYILMLSLILGVGIELIKYYK